MEHVVDLEDAVEVVLAHALASITRPRKLYRMACPFGPHSSPLVRYYSESRLTMCNLDFYKAA